MDAAGEGPDHPTAHDAVPVRRAPWGTRSRLAVAVVALVVAVVVAAVALRSVGVDLGGPVSVAAGATAEGGDDLHRIEPVAVALPSPTSDPAAPVDPAAPGAVGSPGTPTTGAAAGAPPANAPSGGSGTATTLAGGGLLPGASVPPPSDATSPLVTVLPAPLDSTVDSVLQPVDPLLQPLDPLLGGLLGSGTTTTVLPGLG